jgi:predicted Rossmann fold flavoprotein
MRPRKEWDVVVIGGGAAGMMAAGRAAERGKNVLLLEKNPGLGKKLLITGGGRCNVTNNKPDPRVMLQKYKESGKFLFSAFTQFNVKDAVNFFESRGMPMKEENEGRMFPVSNKAKSVWDVLIAYMKEGGVEVRPHSAVTGIRFDPDTKYVVVKLKDKSEIRAVSCVVATGGTSRPETGSTGEGFKWLKNLGHTIIKNDAALVPIQLKDAWVKSAAGVAFNNIKLTTFKGGVKQKSYKGKVLFTHVGISGPAVLNMSREVGELVASEEGEEYVLKASGRGGDVVIMLDLFPAFDVPDLKKKLHALLTEHSNKKIKNTLAFFVPPKLAEPLLMLSGVNGETPCHSVRTEDRRALLTLLKALPLNVRGLLGKNKAVVSSGGVALSEVNFKTMQSRLIPHIYLAGDVLNIDRPSGGYSLQLCWTSGYVAGSNC